MSRRPSPIPSARWLGFRLAAQLSHIASAASREDSHAAISIRVRLAAHFHAKEPSYSSAALREWRQRSSAS